jgi:uncharacterized protein (TIGR03643 family)
MSDKPARSDISELHSEIIEMAWCDKTSFDSIHAQTGLLEKEVIQIMRTYMKPSSFRMWRKRVTGRKAKHDKIKLS